MNSNQEVIDLLQQIAFNTAKTEQKISQLELRLCEMEVSLSTLIQIIHMELSIANSRLESMDISEGYNLKDLWDELSEIKDKITDNGAYNIEDIVDAIHKLEMTVIEHS
jgi:hypothetical protein